MNISVDRKSPIPVGIQIKEQIKMLINSGLIKSGDKLPSINQMAEQLGVNKNTVVTTVNELESEGWVESHRGKGIFITGKSSSSKLDADLVIKIDDIIQDARDKRISSNELVNYINARFSCVPGTRKTRVLILAGINKEVLDGNVREVAKAIVDIEVKGLLLSSTVTREKAVESFNWADIFIVPELVYEYIVKKLPRGKSVIIAKSNLSDFLEYRKDIEKKSKIAVLGPNERGAKLIAGLFVAKGIFRPKYAIGIADVEKIKKELKDVELIVSCSSLKNIVEKYKFKGKLLYYFADSVDNESIQKLKQIINTAK